MTTKFLYLVLGIVLITIVASTVNAEIVGTSFSTRNEFLSQFNVGFGSIVGGQSFLDGEYNFLNLGDTAKITFELSNNCSGAGLIANRYELKTFNFDTGVITTKVLPYPAVECSMLQNLTVDFYGKEEGIFQIGLTVWDVKNNLITQDDASIAVMEKQKYLSYQTPVEQTASLPLELGNIIEGNKIVKLFNDGSKEFVSCIPNQAGEKISDRCENGQMKFVASTITYLGEECTAKITQNISYGFDEVCQICPEPKNVSQFEAVKCISGEQAQYERVITAYTNPPACNSYSKKEIKIVDEVCSAGSIGLGGSFVIGLVIFGAFAVFTFRKKIKKMIK